MTIAESEIDLSTESAGRLRVVGLGASAGGLEALTQFFATMPPVDNLAFVVASHRSSAQHSQLDQILARHTDLPVSTAGDGDPLESGHVYLVPPGALLTLQGTSMQVRGPLSPERERNPIDIFFASLGRELKEHAIGIILSGSGSDGTIGVKAIKDAGGLTIAQSHSASGPGHAGMPDSAIAGGLVDMALPVEAMGVRLRDYLNNLASLQHKIRDDAEGEGKEDRVRALKDVYATLRKRVGHDFEGYKEKTFVRRVQRRMQVLQLTTVREYSERLRESADEAGLLFRDLLIGVTTFFRDREAFEAIAAKVIPCIFANAGAADVVRIWIPGCSTGEEAYSIAILIHEHLSTLPQTPRVQIFATDIDEKAVATARAGRYPLGTLDDVAPEHLTRYFRAETGGYVLSKEVRDLCIFSSHSIIRDPPFSRMDFISCRNLLIYLSSEVQDSVLPMFHYALKPDGFLFLGPAESASRHVDLFSVIDRKHRLFQRRPPVGAASRTHSWLTRATAGLGRSSAGHEVARKDPRLRQYAETRVLDRFAPAHIVVDVSGDIVHYSSRTGNYLEPQMGIPSRQILSLARRGLRLDLRNALREAIESQSTVVRERVEVELDDRMQAIRLTVEPIKEGEQDTLYLIVFSDLGRPVTPLEAPQSQPTAHGDLLGMEQELRETRERLQSTIEEYETALEELKSSNEELVSVNEELQSSNEELETSKEELQSVNEELGTVNNELSGKVDELHRSNADLRNLFDSTQIAIVFLDRSMVIRSFTGAVTEIFSLINADRGRAITDIAHRLAEVDFAADIACVLLEHNTLERTVRTRSGKVFYLMRILPYWTADAIVDGALITFVNVTAVVAAEEQQRVLVSELNHRVRNMLQVVIGLANQTLHRSEDLKHFEQAFMGRMQALARAYDLLSRDGWRNVPIEDLLRIQLSPFASEGSRYFASGERIILQSNAALALGLVLYELATNAIKYGALSVPAGRVDVSWRLDGGANGQRRLLLHWQESGGPPVQAPSRHGFGSELVQRHLRYEFRGAATMDFAPAGLEVMIELPASGSIVEPSGAAADLA